AHRYSLALLETPGAIEAVAAARNWRAKTIRGLALDGWLGLDDLNRLSCHYATGGIKIRWRDEKGCRQREWEAGSTKWFWRGELLIAKGVKTVFMYEGEPGAINGLDEDAETDERIVIALPDSGWKFEAWASLFRGMDVRFFA